MVLATKGDNFISAAERGNVTENGLAAAKFIIPTVLNEFNNTRSQISDEALSLLVAAGNNDNNIAALSNDLAPIADGSDIQAGLIMVEDMRNNIAHRYLRYDNQLPLKKEK